MYLSLRKVLKILQAPPALSPPPTIFSVETLALKPPLSPRRLPATGCALGIIGIGQCQAPPAYAAVALRSRVARAAYLYVAALQQALAREITGNRPSLRPPAATKISSTTRKIDCLIGPVSRSLAQQLVVDAVGSPAGLSRKPMSSLALRRPRNGQSRQSDGRSPIGSHHA